MRGVGATSGFRTGVVRERSSIKHLAHLKRLFPYVRRYAWVLAMAVLGLLLTRLAMNVVPQFMRTAIDSLADPDIPAQLHAAGTGHTGRGRRRSSGFIYVGARRALRRVSVAVTYDLRKRLFNHIQHQGPSFFNRFGTGDLMSRAINDVRMVRHSRFL